ncbi:MAG: hypothetical protein K6C98_01035 [Treponema sp.]|nr:hypothetical protein [Treponema sp.]
MKKSFLSLCFLILIAPVLSAGGFGASGAFFLNQNFDDVDYGVRLDYAADTIPFIFTGDLTFENSGVKGALAGIGFCAGNINLFKALNFFYMPDLCAGYDFLEDKVILENAFYLGFNAFALSHLQFFVQAGWAPQIFFSADDVDLNLVNFPLRAGFRVWSK